MSVKLQINSLEALERLLGGDSELEIEMRKSIAYDFTNKHLKSLANDPFVQSKMDEARRELRNVVDENVRKQIGEVKRTTTYPYNQFVFTNDTNDLIKQAIENSIGDFIRKEVAERVSKKMETIEYKISSESYRQINEKIQTGVKERLAIIQAELTKIPELIKKD
jgi:hypothetical protein